MRTEGCGNSNEGMKTKRDGDVCGRKGKIQITMQLDKPFLLEINTAVPSCAGHVQELCSFTCPHHVAICSPESGAESCFETTGTCERLPSLWHFPSASHRQGAEVHRQAAELILPRTDEFVHSMDLESGMELKTNPLEKSPPSPTVRTLQGELRTLRVHSMHCTVENSPGAGSEWALGGH